MHITPSKITDNILKIYNDIRGKSIQFVDVIPESTSIAHDCHNNCDNSIFPTIKGYYVVMDLNVGCYNLVKHSVIRKYDKLIDITPSGVEKILFIETNHLTYKFYSIIGGYIYMNYTHMKNLQETIKDYYVYGLVDPRNNQVFYVGKGCKNRWVNHMTEKSLLDGSHKSNVIKKIHNDNLLVGVVFLEKNIESEQTAYDIEEQYIRQYGLIKNGGCLTNVCINSNPPNHKGKTYEEIYGEKAEHQRVRRKMLQIQAGGWFGGRRHSEISKEKISKASTGLMNGNSCNLTEEDYLEYGKIFCEIFDGKISRTKWDYFCEANDIPTAYKTFRFDKKNILDIFIENFNATKVWEKQIWFNNGEHQIRISDWKIELIGVPDGYKKGRMKRL